MPPQSIVLALCVVACSATGQLLLRAGARQLSRRAGFEFLLAAAGDIHVLCGLAAWLGSTICWLYVLRVVPLSRAYMLTSLSYVITPLASVYLFGEQVRPRQIGGMVLIVMGVVWVLVRD